MLLFEQGEQIKKEWRWNWHWLVMIAGLPPHVMTERRMIDRYTEKQRWRKRGTYGWKVVLYRLACQHPKPPNQYHLLSIYSKLLLLFLFVRFQILRVLGKRLWRIYIQMYSFCIISRKYIYLYTQLMHSRL